ncbi:MAG: PepSY-associated TM helix domain-containing protein [Planctomycetota bacterium]|nr:PepSY-associated TM helix domain-containing protein [Planctomycetota bacterium]
MTELEPEDRSEVAEAGKQRPKKRFHFKKWLRWFHSYLSLFSLLGLLFFGATGFILNHEEMFGLDKTTRTEDEGELKLELCEKPDKLGVVEALRADYGVRGPLHDFQVEELDLIVMFRQPGRVTDIVINREDGTFIMETEVTGTVATLTEIHHGKNSGELGKRLIDAIAIILVISALTGFILWMTIPKQRWQGALILLLGSGLFAYIISTQIGA